MNSPTVISVLLALGSHGHRYPRSSRSGTVPVRRLTGGQGPGAGRGTGRLVPGRSPIPRTVVVAGASAGVGRATVRRLARPGVSLGLIARGRAGLEAAAREAEAA